MVIPKIAQDDQADYEGELVGAVLLLYRDLLNFFAVLCAGQGR